MNNIYIEKDIRFEKEGIGFLHKFVIKTFSKIQIGDNIVKKLKIEAPDGEIKKQLVKIEIVEKLQGKNIWKGVIN